MFYEFYSEKHVCFGSLSCWTGAGLNSIPEWYYLFWWRYSADFFIAMLFFCKHLSLVVYFCKNHLIDFSCFIRSILMGMDNVICLYFLFYFDNLSIIVPSEVAKDFIKYSFIKPFFNMNFRQKTYTSIPALLFRLDQGRDFLVCILLY